MNKLLASLVVVLVAVNWAACQNSDEILAMRVKAIRGYIYEQQALDSLKVKVEKICPGYGKQFETALGKSQRCINDVDSDSETMCSAVNHYFEKCIAPVKEMFEECLPAKSKETPDMIIKSMAAISKFLCQTDGEHIFELSNPCATSRSYRTERCIRRIHTKFQQFSSQTPSKRDLCDFMESFKGCLESHLQHNCGNHKTRESFLNLYAAAQAPCQSSETENLNEIEILEPKRQ